MILFLIGIFNFPSIGLLLFTILVIAFMFDSGIHNSNIKDVQIKNNTQKKVKFNDPQLQKIMDDFESNDISKIKGATERIGSVLEDIQTLLDKAVKDKKFIKDICFPLVKLIQIQFIHPEGLYGNIKEMISVIDEFTFSILDSYFSGDTENAYKRIKPFAESLKAD